MAKALVGLYRRCNNLYRCIGGGSSNGGSQHRIWCIRVLETYHTVELVESFYFGCKSSSELGFGANPLMVVRFTQEWELVVGNVN
jgi:hypothetical protein